LVKKQTYIASHRTAWPISPIAGPLNFSKASESLKHPIRIPVTICSSGKELSTLRITSKNSNEKQIQADCDVFVPFQMSNEKNPPTFHYTGWLIVILIMVIISI